MIDLDSVLIMSMEYPPFLRGGLGTHVVDLAGNLASRGIRVYVVTYAPYSTPIRTEGNITVLSVSTGFNDFSRFSRATLPAFYALLNRYFVDSVEDFCRAHEIRPSLIHCHDFHTFPAAVTLRTLLNVPILCTVHMLHDPLLRWGNEVPPDTYIQLEAMMCHQADALIVVCKGFGELIKLKYPLSSCPIYVICNSIDSTRYRSHNSESKIANTRRSLGINDQKVIVYAGRLTAQKSIVELIESATNILSVNTNVVFLIAGHFEDAVYAKRVRDAVRTLLPAPSGVRFLGKLSSLDVAQLYSISNIALVPSLYEGVPYAALEAMVAGVPVIATNTCGIEDLIQHRESGVLVPLIVSERNSEDWINAYRYVDVDALTTAQLELLESPYLANYLISNARERIAQQFSLEVMIAETIVTYRKVLNI
jgi:glycogen synthase